jgi:hypothetical protein
MDLDTNLHIAARLPDSMLQFLFRERQYDSRSNSQRIE